MHMGNATGGSVRCLGSSALCASDGTNFGTENPNWLLRGPVHRIGTIAEPRSLFVIVAGRKEHHES